MLRVTWCEEDQSRGQADLHQLIGGRLDRDTLPHCLESRVMDKHHTVISKSYSSIPTSPYRNGR